MSILRLFALVSSLEPLRNASATKCSLDLLVLDFSQAEPPLAVFDCVDESRAEHVNTRGTLPPGIWAGEYLVDLFDDEDRIIGHLTILVQDGLAIGLALHSRDAGCLD